MTTRTSPCKSPVWLLLLFCFLAASGQLIMAVVQTQAASESPAADQTFRSMWNKLTDISREASELSVKTDPYSRSALEVVTFREPKYGRLLKDAQGVLLRSDTGGNFDKIEELLAKNRGIKNQITELRKQRIGAPDSSWNPLATSRKSIDARLASLPNEIEANEMLIEDLKHEILKDMQDHGISLSPEELNYLIISAEGNELVKLMNIAENMKRIQRIIETELQNDRSNVDLARSYTGIYLVSLDAYSYAHEEAMANIRSSINKLGDIKSEAAKNYDEARKLRRTAAETDIANIETNIRLNQRTLEVAEIIGNVLEQRVKDLARRKAQLKKRVDIARNTYKTLVNGATLLDLVKDGWSEYDLLVNFEMPELKNIYDESLISAFTDISERIKNDN